MDKHKLRTLLQRLRKGKVPLSEAVERIGTMGYEDIVFAKVDHHRQHRQGFCEVIYAPGKTVPQIATIAKKLLARSDSLLVTRSDREGFKALKKISAKAVFHENCRAITIEKKPRPRRGKLLVLTAGTSDIRIAEEAVVTARIMGAEVSTVYDVGVAGIHRLMDQRAHLEDADCIIVVAGMDGALASVVGGMVSIPVIAVPTSVGYGAALDGLAPLLAMLNSCASGIAVVNIDNGFGAGALASRIISLKYGKKK